MFIRNNKLNFEDIADRFRFNRMLEEKNYVKDFEVKLRRKHANFCKRLAKMKQNIKINWVKKRTKLDKNTRLVEEFKTEGRLGHSWNLLQETGLRL